MVRLFIFLVVVLALGWGFSWLADRPGLISITWQDHLIETSLMVAATAMVALVGAAMLLWWIVGVIWTSPYSVRRYFRARKRDRGYQALSTGLIAAGAGNALLARKMSLRTRGLISADQEPLIHLLEAQAALIEGKHDEARKKFEQMAEDPETRELGLRGLYMEARRLGANEAARQYAEKAVEHAPYLPWAAQATLESRSQSGRWDDAIRLLDQQRMANILEKPQAERWKAVLLTAKANDRLEGDPKGARDDAMAALKLAKDLVPAAVIAAKAWLREDNVRKAASTLEGVWKLGPHPEIAGAYIRARSGDSTVDRLKRAEKLEAMRPNNIESLLAVAQAALDAQQFKKARAKAEAAARMQPREAVYLLLADIEEAETGDQGRVRHWMAQALRAPRDPAWVADGFVSEKWLPLSPVTGRLDAFEWKAPFDQLEGPVEEGSLAADTAIASLPPVREIKPEPRAEEAPKPILVEVKPAPQEAKPLEKELAVAAKTPAPANVTSKGGKTPENGEEPVPFFGRPPDDPGVKDPDAAQPATRLRLF
ncbi:heme biosynthesis protein HemY [Neorhizobium galegae]|uniref:heme biosynthesis protein HemY n=1 Tax=Neorhizobium galegae TaxID=399 RepID=UPI0012841A0D|nr:heme biosynthesis protein HemY [Neorhizobium galegae]KAA9384976.1 heme biosynthesis protein HemY [Neorhizobium galegae]KAB1116328.1 heme biosynthesis protein HemY [Neorhizobium galegae]MCM2497707.1 heme biosynthesis protein HemY [Neorhizobium galegae]MCQ1774680.1 heme biosynthesis protein HemY [Neorhizobium galegae]MCQ1780974.1 heme biosynthesis protein HemY [Neorhizobium galegae]